MNHTGTLGCGVSSRWRAKLLLTSLTSLTCLLSLWAGPALGAARYTDTLNGFSLKPPTGGVRVQREKATYVAAWIENDKLVKAPDTLMQTGKWKPIKEGNWECRPGPMVTGWDPYQNIPTTTKKAVEFLIDPKRAEKPYFLYFALPAPHAPIIPNDEFDGKSKAGAYGDFVYEIDHAIGQLLEAVKKSGGEDR